MVTADDFARACGVSKPLLIALDIITIICMASVRSGCEDTGVSFVWIVFITHLQFVMIIALLMACQHWDRMPFDHRLFEVVYTIIYGVLFFICTILFLTFTRGKTVPCNNGAAYGFAAFFTMCLILASSLMANMLYKDYQSHSLLNPLMIDLFPLAHMKLGNGVAVNAAGNDGRRQPTGAQNPYQAYDYVQV